MGNRRWKAGEGALTRYAAALALVLATPAGAQSVALWQAQIEEASARFGVPQQWIRRVIAAESGGRIRLNGRPITSRAGAMGLMQLMPGTWAEMRARHGLGPDPHDPRDNILAGTAYLRAMYDRFGYPGLFAAYNAGPSRYAEHLSSGRRLPGETVTYIAEVAGDGTAPRPNPASRAPASLFAALTAANLLANDAEREPTAGAPDALFVQLSGAAPR